MSAKPKLSSARRKSQIRHFLYQQPEVSIGQLAETFSVSEMTIRRDLDGLEAVGQVRRTHGGAVLSDRMVFEFNFVNRRRANQKAKRAIAAEAVKFVKPGDRLILDNGTTTLELAYLLKDFGELTILTPSLAVASELQFSEGIETVLLGGVLRRGSPDLTGLVAETVLDMFAVDIAFQGADAIGPDGAMYTADIRSSPVDRKIRKRASRTYILVDSSKFGKTAFSQHGFVYEVDAIITDEGISKKHKSALKKIGAQQIIVKLDR